MPLGPIDTLSDNETNDVAAPPGPQKKKSVPRMPGKGFRLKVSRFGKNAASAEPRYLANLIRSKCGCKAGCFSAIRANSSHVDSWMRTRKNLAGMTKLEKDQYVRDLPTFNTVSGHVMYKSSLVWSLSNLPSHCGATEVFKILQDQDRESCRGSRHLRFLGHPVCNRAFMKIFGLGKHRFKTLSTAARKGEEFCPYDGRCIIRGKRTPSLKWEKVHGFLMQLYLEAAEPIPDGLNSNKRPRHGDKKTDAPDLDRSQLKHLPHGTINDYWRQCAAALPDLGVSRKLFCSESCLNLWCHLSFAKPIVHSYDVVFFENWSYQEAFFFSWDVWNQPI